MEWAVAGMKDLLVLTCLCRGINGSIFQGWVVD